MTGEATVLLAAAAAPRDDVAQRLGVLFDAHHERLYRLARRLCRTADDARDLIQDTFLRAARHASRVPAGAVSEEAWLVRVMVNICRDRWRQSASRARHKEAVATLHPLPPANPEAAFIARSVVWHALSALPPRRRAVVALYELEGVSIAAIARLLGVTPVTVRWHLSMGRRDMVDTIRGPKRGRTPFSSDCSEKGVRPLFGRGKETR
jgi:RNA polymerase sigma-70 factor (ECF subfamily)